MSAQRHSKVLLLFTGSTDVGLAVATAAVYSPRQHLHSCVVCCHVEAGTPKPALELLTARGRSEQMAGGVSGDWHRVGGVAGRDYGSHLASVLALCPGASSTFTRQKACQELGVTLRKTLYSLEINANAAIRAHFNIHEGKIMGVNNLSQNNSLPNYKPGSGEVICCCPTTIVLCVASSGLPLAKLCPHAKLCDRSVRINCETVARLIAPHLHIN